MAEAKRRIITFEEREKELEKALDQAAKDRADMEEIVKFVYLAKHKNTRRDLLIGVISDCVTYKGNTFNIITSVNWRDITKFEKNGGFLAYV